MTAQVAEGTGQPAMRRPDIVSAGRMAVLAVGLAGVPFAGAVCAQERSAAVAAEAQTARGVVEPRTEATLSSQIAARIARITIDRGQRVKAGDVLVEFDCAMERARLKAVQAEQAGAGAKLANLRHLTQLGSVGRLDAQIAAAEVDKAVALVEQQRIVIERCTVTAPYNGIIVDVMAHANDSVEAGKPLVSLLDDSSLRLVILAPSHWSAWLKPDVALTFTIDETGERIPAKVLNLSGRIDSVSQTITVYADMRRTSALPLIAGMTGSASIQPLTAPLPFTSKP